MPSGFSNRCCGGVSRTSRGTATERLARHVRSERSGRCGTRSWPRLAWQALPVRIRRICVEVKIGVLHTPREIVLESSQSPDEVEKTVAEALKSVDGQLSLTDDKGRRVIVPAN